MTASVAFTAEEEAALRALAEETGRSVSKLVHFIALYGAAEYHARVEEAGVLRADAIVVHTKEQFRMHQEESARLYWPKNALTLQTPTADDLPQLFEE